ncbi:MAG: gamma-glutamyl-gamma-aminobutyrate hydrolase family protein [Selenomonadales bacterium]|nr:gamma-glutamyl-gamma-aminobutyrate hydrolase family protein [Selenomonadales bacterium]
MTRKPTIGVTCFHDWQEQRHRQNDTYINAIKKAGGLPVLLPCLTGEADLAAHLDLVDGLLVAGGPDADPVFFGEEPEEGLGNVNPCMDAYELPVIAMALRRDMPVLGICRGVQMLNIAAGGSVIQHLPAAVRRVLKHQQSAPRSYVTHAIDIAAGTLLSRILGEGTTRVNSFHHQAVGRVALGFCVSAVAPDGVVEAIESTEHKFALGVQWHPECMWDATPNFDPLFTAFVLAAQNYGQIS